MKKIENKNFSSCVEYDYDSESNCSENGCEGDYCRCTTLSNACVKKVNFLELVDNIYDLYFDNSKSTIRNYKINSILFGITEEVDRYTIDRVLRVNKVWDPEIWNVEVVNGYYGEEIGDITLFGSVSRKIEKELNEAIKLDILSNRIEYLLKLEYGYVLPILKDCNYEITNVNIDNIIFGSDSNYKKSKKEDLAHYSDKSYSGIRGVVVEKDGKYRLIDGYHRCIKSKSKIITVIKAVK